MNEISIVIADERDIAEAARGARNVAGLAGLDKTESYYVATAASELAANMYFHAGGGLFEAHIMDNHRGVELVATDHGPGIADMNKAMCDGFSTTGSLGCGLPGARRLMDEMEIITKLGCGTSVTVRKWMRT
jgi:serine/threonine-protein kinase RsbT